MTEQEARHTDICPGCGKAKELGQTVCWDCFKHPALPYKTWNGDFESWLEEMKRIVENRKIVQK